MSRLWDAGHKWVKTVRRKIIGDLTSFTCTKPRPELFRRQISDFIYHLLCLFVFLTNHRLERSLYVKLKDWISNSVDLDETAHLNLCYLQKPIIIACGSERVNSNAAPNYKHMFGPHRGPLPRHWNIIFTNTMLKQSTGLDGDLKPEHKKITRLQLRVSRLWNFFFHAQLS